MSTKLRQLVSEVVSGTDAATLATALNALWEAAGEATLVSMMYVADFKVLVTYVR